VPATLDAPVQNDILDALPADEWRSLREFLSHGIIARGVAVQRQARPGSFLYFPCGGVCSVVAHTDAGHAVEVALIGREGVVGLEVLGGDRTAVCDVIVQVAAPRWYRLDATVLRSRCCPRLNALVGGYAVALVGMICQTVACNTFHPVDRRLARWLLMVGDRVDSDEILLTQDLLALMLGVRRATVTLAVGALQRVGAIRYGKGVLHVTSRTALEATACDCYVAPDAGARRAGA
jgi:CRP-like cAMP-binding protein